MKKLCNRKGFTLMETLVALAVVAILVMGMGATMNTAVRVYGESIFESNSGTLAGILNTSLGDVLRFSDDVTENPGNLIHNDGTEIPKADADFIFTNYEYGAINSYFVLESETGDSPRTILKMRNLIDTVARDLVNTGAYPELAVKDFKVIFTAPTATEKGNYFTVTYQIYDVNKSERQRNVEYVIRLMNPID